jgi:hypothetical protein
VGGRVFAAGVSVCPVISGVEAELVFARIANVYPNLETERPGGADCVVGGRTVDIKWSLTGW